MGTDTRKSSLVDRMFRDNEDRPPLRPQRETLGGTIWRWSLWGAPTRDGTESPLKGRTLAAGVWMILVLGIVALIPGLGNWRVWPPPHTESVPGPGGEGNAATPVTEPVGPQDENLTPEEESFLKVELEAPPSPAPGVAASWVDPTPEERCRLLNCEAAGNHKPPNPDALLEATPDIEDPGGRGLARFRTVLQTLAKERKGLVRVAHYGDSLITGDFVTGTMRRLLQEKYGDAGPGFHLASKAWDWYAHEGVTMNGPDGKISRITTPTIKDRLYGFGGVTAVFPPGTTLSYKIAKPKTGPVRAELYYLAQPAGGTIQVLGDGEPITSVQTASSNVRSGFQSITLPLGATKLTLKTAGGSVRLFGLVFETDGPGVAYDSIGINGGHVGLLMRIDPDHWAEQLAHRKPDLVVFEFGTNESMNENLKASRYEKELRAVIARFRKALPDASCLVMAPMDRGVNGPNGVSTAPTVPMLVLSQRKVALTEGCAFFNTFKAMGGTDSYSRWMAAKPKLASGDFAHPTPSGAELVGRMFFRALERATQ